MVNWTKYHQLLLDAESILLTTHENPDGDGLGCETAFYEYLTGLGKDCRIINTSPFPTEYTFLNPDNRFEEFDKKTQAEWISNVDLAIILDIGDYKRMNVLWDELETNKILTLNIDHHPHLKNSPFTHNIIDVKAAATGEIIFDYLKRQYNGTIPTIICEGIYVAIMTDTGSFRHNNTTINSHQIAIECIQNGIDATGIYQKVYESHSRNRMALLGRVLANLNYTHNGEVAWFAITQELLSEANANKEDVEGFTDIVRTIQGVEIATMIFQKDENSCRVNFRSKGKYIIGDVARSLGGGGHDMAAGAVVNGNVQDVVKIVLTEIERSLSDLSE